MDRWGFPLLLEEEHPGRLKGNHLAQSWSPIVTAAATESPLPLGSEGCCLGLPVLVSELHDPDRGLARVRQVGVVVVTTWVVHGAAVCAGVYCNRVIPN